MFYSGGLQAGISLAVTEGKAVVCFVRGLSVIPRTAAMIPSALHMMLLSLGVAC